MRAIAVRKFHDAPEMMDLPKPTPGKGEVLVHVVAAGVNPYDWKIVDGALDGVFPHVFPLILGVDGAGVVEAVGEGVQRFQVGDGIFGQFLHPPVGVGTYAEYTVVPENIGVSKTPRGVYSAQAAAVPTAGMTALQALQEIGSTKAQTLLLIGAGGGVGSFATQLAANQGINVLAVSHKPSHDLLLKLGAFRFFDAESMSLLDEIGNAYPAGVDALLDLVNSGPAFEAHLRLLKEKGIAASTIGAASSPLIAEHGLRGINVDLHPTAALLDHLSKELALGRLRVPLDAQVPLAEAPAVLARSREGRSRGKTVLVI